jgi:methionyl-tRNA formyltransferase
MTTSTATTATKGFRALFLGTPAFSVPCLDALAEVATVVGVVCQPDKPQGRGLVLAPPPVKVRAEELGLPVVQPTKLKTGELAQWVRDQDADVALVVAYGRILPPDVLAGPRLGCVNVHASLLPKYRGAAPITWAIVHGERETGITLMQMDAGMDTGAMLEVASVPIGEDETAADLAARLAQVGADLVRRGLPKYVRGEYAPEKQDDTKATLAPLLKKEDGKVSFAQPPRAVHDHVRGMTPWPGAYLVHRGKTVKVLAARATPLASAARPGTVLIADKSGVFVACERGAVELVTVQPECRKSMRGADWALGRGVAQGDVLGGDAVGSDTR